MTTLYTIGHGNRPAEELAALLREAGVRSLVDVRALPASRRNPQFSRAALERSLPAAGIRYRWEGTALGGRRKLEGDSPHLALREPAFRAYAGHMASAEFRAAVEALAAAGKATPTAVLCAERLPEQCHRSFIADALVVGGARVVHLIAPGQSRTHVLNPVLRLREGQFMYDGETQGRLRL